VRFRLEAVTIIETRHHIDADVAKVFDVVAHIDNFAKAVPHLVNVEHINDVHSGVGAKFRETRLMNRREASTELEVTEYVKNERVRMVSDEGGTIWDTVFTVEPSSNGAGTDLTMVMDCRPYERMAKIVTPLVKPIVARAVKGDMEAVKNYCESAEFGESPE